MWLLFSVLVALAWSSVASIVAPVSASPLDGSINVENCHWSDPNDVIDHIIAGSLNVTEIVVDCKEVCSLVYGSSNPDISGKGVMVSYYAQFILVGLFTLLLPVFHFLVSTLRPQDGAWNSAVKVLRKCQASVNEISGFYCLTIFVAVVVRYSQTPPVLEIIFMDRLLSIQGVVVTTVLSFQLFETQINHIVYSDYHSVYNIALFIAQLTISYTISIRHDAFPIFFEASRDCARLHNYPDTSSFFLPAVIAPSALSRAGAFGLGVLIFFAVCFTVNMVMRLEISYPAWLRMYVWHAAAGPFVVFYIWTFVTMSIELESVREYTAGADGDQQDGWGYGQTTAVLLWIPLLRTALKAVWDEWSGKPSGRAPENIAPQAPFRDEPEAHELQHPSDVFDAHLPTFAPRHSALQATEEPVSVAGSLGIVAANNRQIAEPTVVSLQSILTSSNEVHPSTRTSSWERIESRDQNSNGNGLRRRDTGDL
ncbi:hypothetical protein B0T22DRAFT_189652 [Podospora appendiculata]|uniref:Uncharacterized protein n=1 Tax=Podospora appendiculata TaxID=314037 RepID=A0AAE1CDX2_9PEZI|nr:hypothetical protein B0T22DRAFT_189652 [Podospora appendiculata]